MTFKLPVVVLNKVSLMGPLVYGTAALLIPATKSRFQLITVPGLLVGLYEKTSPLQILERGVPYNCGKGETSTTTFCVWEQPSGDNKVNT